MTCENCGSALPAGALFCGECGRAVAPPVLAPAKVRRLIEPPPVLPPTSEAPTVIGPEKIFCEQCGAAMSVGDIFCGECGHVSRVITSLHPIVRDTARIDPVALPHVPRPPRPLADDALDDEALDYKALDHIDDVEATRISAGRGRGERFVLQFSTGESVTVFGTGLAGRNPLPEPGEYFDHLVRVLDSTRSVSKTHLEFGQEAGEFWIRDRYSGNGSVVRAPEGPPYRCDPGKRYRISRGTRVDIGEQFFVVS